MRISLQSHKPALCILVHDAISNFLIPDPKLTPPLHLLTPHHAIRRSPFAGHEILFRLADMPCRARQTLTGWALGRPLLERHNIT
jgi:hypothetical protein